MLDNNTSDPKTIWQSQKNEETRMTLELLRQRVRDLDARRRRNLLTTVLTVAIVLSLSAFGIMRTHSAPLQAIFVLSSAWALAGLYFVRRGLRSSELLDDSTLRTGIEFYRWQIEQNLAIFNRILPWTLGPAILAIIGLAAVLAGIAQEQNQRLARIVPFCILFVLWLIALPVVRSGRRRELRKELDLLNSLENGR